MRPPIRTKFSKNLNRLQWKMGPLIEFTSMIYLLKMAICHSYVELHLWVFPVKQYLRFSSHLRAERMILVIEFLHQISGSWIWFAPKSIGFCCDFGRSSRSRLVYPMMGTGFWISKARKYLIFGISSYFGISSIILEYAWWVLDSEWQNVVFEILFEIPLFCLPWFNPW